MTHAFYQEESTMKSKNKVGQIICRYEATATYTTKQYENFRRITANFEDKEAALAWLAEQRQEHQRQNCQFMSSIRVRHYIETGD